VFAIIVKHSKKGCTHRTLKIEQQTNTKDGLKLK